MHLLWYYAMVILRIHPSHLNISILGPFHKNLFTISKCYTYPSKCFSEDSVSTLKLVIPGWVGAVSCRRRLLDSSALLDHLSNMWSMRVETQEGQQSSKGLCVQPESTKATGHWQKASWYCWILSSRACSVSEHDCSTPWLLRLCSRDSFSPLGLLLSPFMASRHQ